LQQTTFFSQFSPVRLQSVDARVFERLQADQTPGGQLIVVGPEGLIVQMQPFSVARPNFIDKRRRYCKHLLLC
jgi:hypothetical protein